MLKRERIPTPLVQDVDKEPVKIVPFKKVKHRGLAVFRGLSVCLARIFWMWITRRLTPQKSAEEVSLLIERLGYLWIKAGQLMSLRSDILSPEMCHALSRLQHSANGFPLALSRKLIEDELGHPVERTFAEFEAHPFAAASIAQVHKARLRNGASVVIKVMRPGAEEIFASDINFFRSLIGWFTRLRIMPFMRWEEAIWELEQIMLEEVDYRYELSNLRMMRKQLREHKIYVPKAFKRYCTKRILVIEMIEGVLMSDYIKMRLQDPNRLKDWMLENNVDPIKVGEHLYLSFMRQLLEENQFHGDLHPGNIMLLKDSRIVFIDLGTVGRVEQTLLKKYTLIMKATANMDFAKAADLFLSLTSVFPATELDHVKEEMVRILRAWHMRTPVKSLTFYEKSFTEAVVEISKVMTNKRIMITWGFLKIDRTWATMDSSLNYMVPEVDFPKLFRRYFRQRERRYLKKLKDPKVLRSVVTEIPDIISEYSIFLDPPIRRIGRLFTTLPGKAARAVATVFDVVTSISMVGGLFLAAIIAQTYFGIDIFGTDDPWLKKLIGYAEQAKKDHGEWFGPAIVIAAFYIIFKIRTIGKTLKEPGVRLPSADRID